MSDVVVLTKATASCPMPDCAHAVHQVDTTRERAIRIVTEAMDRHMAEEHPEVEA